MVGHSQEVFNAINQDYLSFAKQLGGFEVTSIPISALQGDNIYTPSDQMPWYTGTSLMTFLETVEIEQNRLANLPFRMPIQWVNRPHQDFRGFSGTIASGIVEVGQLIRVKPLGRQVNVASIVTKDGHLKHAVAGQSVTITLTEEVDASRGDMFSATQAPATVANQFQAHLVWMTEDPLLPGRNYWLKCGPQLVNASVTQIKHQINVNTLEHIDADKLELNAVAECNLTTDKALIFDSYAENSSTGSFVLIDRISNLTVAAGVIDHPLRKALHIHTQFFQVNKEARAKLNNQKPCVFWFTGLSGSGKSTLANELEKKLFALGHRTYVLDGDNVRHGLSKDLSFTPEDRVENIRRVAEVAKLMVDAGLIVLATFISPYQSDRKMARAIFKEDEFFEIFIDTPMDICEQRDPKGLYKKARNCQIENFTGIDSPYEAPEKPELVIETQKRTVDEAVALLVKAIRERT
jgi:bifunctional enzyme CysN/CysC